MGGESKTELMLNYLVEGMCEAGAEVDVVNLRKKNIKNCIGCYTCWTRTPGECLQKDDITQELFPKWLKSIKTPFDIWMDIITGKAEGDQMLIEGMYEAEGDMNLLLNMNKFFGRSK